MKNGRQRTRVAKAGSDKREQVAQTLGAFQTLGDVVTFDPPPNGAKSKHKDVVQALKDSALDDKVAREFIPRHAFTRACHKLAEERVIDIVREDSDEALFQFSRRERIADATDGGDEMVYRKEAKILLKKATGTLSCKDPQVQAQAQKELDRCMEERTTSDITTIVKRLFERSADLIPLRANGGVYLVLKEHLSYADQVELFLSKLGTGWVMNRLPIPAGTQRGDRTVQMSVRDHLSGLLSDMDQAVEAFGSTTRISTIESVADRIADTRVKIEAYASYLQDRKEELLAAVDAANEKLVKQIEKLTGERTISDGSGIPSDNGSVGGDVAAQGMEPVASGEKSPF